MLKQLFFLIDLKRQKFFLFIIFLILIGTLIEIAALGNIYKLIETLVNQKKEIFNISIISKKYSFDKIFFIQILTISLVSIYILKFFFFNLLSYLQFNFVYTYRHYVSKRLISKYIKSNYLEFIKKKTSVLIRNIDKEASILADGVLLNIISLVTEVIILSGILIFLLFVQFESTIFIILLLSVLFLLFFLIFKKKVYNYGKIKQNISADYLTDILQLMNGFKDIKIFNKEDFFLKKFTTSSKNLANISTKQVFLFSLSRYSIELILILTISLFIFYSIKENSNLNSIFLTIGIYAAAAFRVIPSLNKIIGSTQRIISSKSSIDLIYKELKNNLLSNYDQNNDVLNFNKSVEFKNISFSYPSSHQKILENVNFEIKRNEITAIIGESGCGKSTLVDIISGLIKPHSGNIFIDSKKINKNYDQIVTNISYLSQNYFLLNDTILNNILFGSDENNVDYTQIDEILSDLQLKDFIQKSPEGLNKIIGEGGVELSGGQGQRIALARCFYADRDIVILDEATSALDVVTENSILKLIKKMKKNKAIIVVSHRENVMEFADKIVKLNNNRT
jgi:ATP-binding cassette, subfamily B, bacterial PglK